MTLLALRWRMLPPALGLRFRMLPPTLSLRWRGPDQSIFTLGALPGQIISPLPPVPAPQPLAAIIGPPGETLPASTLELASDVAVVAGMPLAISRSTGHFIEADAAVKAAAFVAGLAAAPTSIGFVAECERNALELGDWTAIAGTLSLSPGQVYFLGVGGGLTTTPPSAPNCIASVGVALSSTTLLIEPQSPIQL